MIAFDDQTHLINLQGYNHLMSLIKNNQNIYT